ncbi:MAG: hypothetical protein IIV90_05325 [Oscillospiraceae bacterium]|nr:hypothetical protein [Oscillospiraceae bacterium]
MASVYFEVRRLPDLTLNKYSALEGGGISDVLEMHRSFYRQLHRKGMLSRSASI